jgi:hypothetical protein
MTESDQDCVDARTGQKDGQMREERAVEELLRPGIHLPARNRSGHSIVHIRLDQAAFIGCRRLQRYTGETVLYFAAGLGQSHKPDAN